MPFQIKYDEERGGLFSFDAPPNGIVRLDGQCTVDDGRMTFIIDPKLDIKDTDVPGIKKLEVGDREECTEMAVEEVVEACIDEMAVSMLWVSTCQLAAMRFNNSATNVPPCVTCLRGCAEITLELHAHLDARGLFPE